MMENMGVVSLSDLVGARERVRSQCGCKGHAIIIALDDTQGLKKQDKGEEQVHD